ncbi:M81 family metallopeptidase [Bradyrhizobium sp. SEMIA]|uniref:M81 family metallopeptidase n=1 Tax=Bradyrhizobium sp. SEMIA TaxID=2597515 RepID=UPI003A101B47
MGARSTLVGPKCIIGVEVDPHCHLTTKCVKLADAIVLYNEYPLTDGRARRELVRHCA